MYLFKECEYYIHNNFLYVNGIIKDTIGYSCCPFFWKINLKGDGYEIFVSVIELILKEAKYNENLIEKYNNYKKSKNKAVINKYCYKDNVDNIRNDYNNGKCSISSLVKKYGGSVHSIHKVIQNESYRIRHI